MVEFWSQMWARSQTCYLGIIRRLKSQNSNCLISRFLSNQLLMPLTIFLIRRIRSWIINTSLLWRFWFFLWRHKVIYSYIYNSSIDIMDKLAFWNSFRSIKLLELVELRFFLCFLFLSLFRTWITLQNRFRRSDLNFGIFSKICHSFSKRRLFEWYDCLFPPTYFLMTLFTTDKVPSIDNLCIF